MAASFAATAAVPVLQSISSGLATPTAATYPSKDGSFVLPGQKVAISSVSRHKAAFGADTSAQPRTVVRSHRNMSVQASAYKSVAATFKELKSKGECALIPFICAGDPSLAATADVLKVLDEAGASVIELGVPYSDPLADGPVIQAAASRALRQGVKLKDVLRVMEQVAPTIKAPIVLFTYYNPIMKYGLREFMREIKRCGASGAVVPDVPLEETSLIREVARDAGIELTLLVTPTTPKERMRLIADKSEGFVYLVSVAGVTGTRTEVASNVEGLLKELKSGTDKPVAVGFGISQPEHAVQVKKWGADGVIVGSALVRLLGEAKSPQEGLQAVRQLMVSIKQGMAGVSAHV